MPASYARITACTRSRRPSLASTWPTCVLTVASLTNRATAISALLRPRATCSKMSRSRAVSDASSDGDGAKAGGRRTNASIRRRVTVGASSALPAAAGRLEDDAESGPDKLLVVGDEDADGIRRGSGRPARLGGCHRAGSLAVTAKPPAPVGPAVRLPPQDATRSAIPARP